MARTAGESLFASRAGRWLCLVLATVLLPCSFPAAAQEEEGSGVAPIAAARAELWERSQQEMARIQTEFDRGSNPQIEKHFATEEAAARSRAEFFAKYDDFARRVMDLLQEMRDKPGVVPLGKLMAVQKAWAAWQKCKEWPAAKQ